MLVVLKGTMEGKVDLIKGYYINIEHWHNFQQDSCENGVKASHFQEI